MAYLLSIKQSTINYGLISLTKYRIERFIASNIAARSK